MRNERGAVDAGPSETAPSSDAAVRASVCDEHCAVSLKLVQSGMNSHLHFATEKILTAIPEEPRKSDF